MSFSIDTLPNSNFIREYAAQFNQIPTGFVRQCDECFNGNESKEFYRGLLIGYANAQNLLRQVDPNSTNSINSLGMIVSYISRRYLDMNTL
jgi:hypothetical protein